MYYSIEGAVCGFTKSLSKAYQCPSFPGRHAGMVSIMSYVYALLPSLDCNSASHIMYGDGISMENVHRATMSDFYKSIHALEVVQVWPL